VRRPRNWSFAGEAAAVAQPVMTFRRHYKTLSKLQAWQCSASSSTTVWLRPTMLAVYWQHVHGCCMPYECCAVMACQHHQCTTCSGQPWLRGLCTALWRGLDSAWLQTVWGWMPFYVVVNDLATAAVTLQLWQKWLRKRTKSYLATFYQTTIMSYNSTYLSDRARSTTLGHELTTKHW